MQRHKTVDEYIESAAYWQDELRTLRKILKSLPLEETVKWGGPCYTVDGKNVVGLGAFRSYVGLWFFQGVLMQDPEGVLVNAQEGKTRAQRQWRFHSMQDINNGPVRAYVREAISLQKEGQSVRPHRASVVRIPEVLSQALKKDKKAAAGFDGLTPGRRREYAEYVAEAKREQTKAKRVEKILPMIAAGQGLNDRYRGSS